MQNIHPTMRPFVTPWAPKEPVDPLQAARAEDWAAVQQAEAQDPRLLRALRDQQQYLQNTGVLS